MKKRAIMAFATLIVLAFAVAVYAYQANSGTSGSSHSCCAMAECCKDGHCKMGGECCGMHGSCPMKKEKQSADSGDRHPNVVYVGGEDGDSCCKPGASCCNGGSCCTKTKTEAVS